jgi:hypothetical protein
MMKFIGNYGSWIQDIWNEELLIKEGQARPKDRLSVVDTDTVEYRKIYTAAYNLGSVYWWVYESKDVSFDILPPWIDHNNFHWWITKLTPGQMMPVHTDPHTHEQPCKRYWVPLQNYQAGHVFIINDEMISNYSKGDVYEYDDPQAVHGAANISHVPRLVLQVTEYVV